MLTRKQKSKVERVQNYLPRTVEDDLAKATDKILFLEKQVLEAERTIQILTVAGFISTQKVEEARALVQSLIWK